MSTREWFEEWLLNEKKPKQQKPQKSHSAVWVAYHDDEPNMNSDPITEKDIPRLAGMNIPEHSAHQAQNRQVSGKNRRILLSSKASLFPAC